MDERCSGKNRHSAYTEPVGSRSDGVCRRENATDWCVEVQFSPERRRTAEGATSATGPADRPARAQQQQQLSRRQRVPRRRWQPRRRLSPGQRVGAGGYPGGGLGRTGTGGAMGPGGMGNPSGAAVTNQERQKLAKNPKFLNITQKEEQIVITDSESSRTLYTD